MRAYSISRPIDLFTYPKQYAFTDKVNFNGRRYVEEIGREAWGYIDYAEDVPEDELNRFELVTAEMCQPPALPPEHVISKMAKLLFDDNRERFEKMCDKVEAKGYDMEALDIELGRALRKLHVSTFQA